MARAETAGTYMDKVDAGYAAHARWAAAQYARGLLGQSHQAWRAQLAGWQGFYEQEKPGWYTQNVDQDVMDTTSVYEQALMDWRAQHAREAGSTPPVYKLVAEIVPEDKGKREPTTTDWMLSVSKAAPWVIGGAAALYIMSGLFAIKKGYLRM